MAAVKYRNIEICQQVEYLKGKNMNSTKKILEKDERISQYAYILHDKDINSETGKPIAPHYHIMLGFNDTYYLSTIMGMFNNEFHEGCFQKIKTRWAKALAYLTHRNHPEKYQYDPEEVVSNFEWEEESEKGMGLTEIVSKIISGEIRRYNYTKFIPGEMYIKYKRQIEAAFNYRNDAIQQLGGDRKMECIYVTGGSGQGKTTYAKAIAEKQGYSYFISGGSNDPLDGYAGQDCFILDELRPSCMGLSDLLKMLDNNTSSTIKSRYKNKYLECKLIIITTTLSIDAFFRKVFSEEIETSKQLKRRCRLLVKFPKGDNEDGPIKMYRYNSSTNSYDFIQEQENPLKKIVRIEEKKLEDDIALLSL